MCIPAVSAQHTFSHSLPLPRRLSLLPSREVNIFCRKADGELVLTTSRSASQSLQPSRQPHCVSLACVCVGVCVRYNSMASPWQIYTSPCTFNNSITVPVSLPQLSVSLWNRAKCHQAWSISLLASHYCRGTANSIPTRTSTHSAALL